MTVVQRPPERDLAFLTHVGIAPDVIRDISADAIRLNVPPDRMALASGLVDEIQLYSALAVELGLPFVNHPVKADPASPYPACVTSGVLKVRRQDHVAFGRFRPNAKNVIDSKDLEHCSSEKPVPTFSRNALDHALLLAPQGQALQHLRALGARHEIRGAAITTPTNLRRSAMLSFADRIERAALYDLEARHPESSARSGWSRSQKLGGLAAFGALNFLCACDWQTTLQAAAVLIGILFMINVLLRIASAVVPGDLELSESPAAIPDRALPTYTIIVPLNREARIVGQLVRALLALDYPAAKLDIKFVLEADDHKTRRALETAMPAGRCEILIAPPAQLRTKPRALNMALALARGEFCVIYDAEDVPDPDQLRRAVAAFRRLPENTACLQAHLSIDNMDDSWLTRSFTIEYAVLFDALIPSLALLGWPVMLGGTSNHFRTAILRRAGGWDAWNVTEDADLGLRLSRLDYRVGDLASTTLEEAPVDLSAWMRQRSRWLKGWMQTCMVQTRHPLATIRQIGPSRFLVGLALSLGTVLTALFGPLLFAWTINELASGSLLAATTIPAALVRGFALMLLLTGFLATFVPAIAALRERELGVLLPWLALMPLYHLLVSLAAWRALWEWIDAPQRWNKTEHGFARSSRARQRAARAEENQKHAAKADATTSRKTASARQAHNSPADANRTSTTAPINHLAGFVAELDAGGVR